MAARQTPPTGPEETHQAGGRPHPESPHAPVPGAVPVLPALGDGSTPAGRGAGLVARGQRLWTGWQRTRVARALARFGIVGGGVLTGGIAYNALFSVVAALTLGYTIFMAVLGGNEALREDVLAVVDANLPGLLDTGDGGGLLRPDDLVLETGFNLAGLGAIAVLVYTALRAMAALRTAMRAVFGVATDPQNLLVGKLRELASIAGVALMIVLAALLSLALTSLAGTALGALGGDRWAQAVGQVLGVLVAFGVDVAMFVLIVVVLAGVHPPRRELLRGAVLAAVGMGALRLLGTSVVAGSTDSNALLAGFTVLVTLLIWVNLLARVILLAGAWTADPPMPVDAAELPDRA